MVSLAVIDKAVAQHFRVAAADLARHGRRVGAAKIVAVELACRLTELSQRAIGEHDGGIGSAAVSTIHRKCPQWPACRGKAAGRRAAKIRFSGLSS